MQKNRIDDMEIMDLAFCGCIAILGMEAMNIATKALGSEWINNALFCSIASLKLQ